MTLHRAEAIAPIFNESNCKKLGFEALRVMYPDPDDEQAVAIGKSVCDNCVAFDACRTRGMTVALHDEGVYAAMTRPERERARRNINKERSRHAARARTSTEY